MGNRFFVWAFLLLFTAGSVAAREISGSTFLSSLESCSPYTETQADSHSNLKIEIVGWENGKCTYKNEVFYDKSSHMFTCRFTPRQINKLISAVEEDLKTLKYDPENDLTSFRSVWQSYLNDENTCTRVMSVIHD